MLAQEIPLPAMAAFAQVCICDQTPDSITPILIDKILGYRIIFKQINIDSCEPYGGISSGNICCAANCGICGGVGCSDRPGGTENCCTNKIPLETICGAGQMAPCHIKNGKFQMLKQNYAVYNGHFRTISSSFHITVFIHLFNR